MSGASLVIAPFEPNRTGESISNFAEGMQFVLQERRIFFRWREYCLLPFRFSLDWYAAEVHAKDPSTVIDTKTELARK